MYIPLVAHKFLTNLAHNLATSFLNGISLSLESVTAFLVIISMGEPPNKDIEL